MALLQHAEAFNYPQQSLLLLLIFLQLVLHLLVLLYKLLIASLVDVASVCALAHDVSDLCESSLHFLELLLTAMGKLREDIQFFTGYLQSLAFSLTLLLLY